MFSSQIRTIDLDKLFPQFLCVIHQQNKYCYWLCIANKWLTYDISSLLIMIYVQVAAAVSQTFTEAKPRYGAPHLADELPEYNIETIAASLRRQGLRAKASRTFSPVSYREHGLPVSENLLKQDFIASGPNQKWAGDITYLRTDEGWLYLAVVLDLWSRAVIG